MEKPEKNKLNLPNAIVICCLILGGVFYLTQTNKQESIGDKGGAFTKSSKEYAVMGKEVWSAFECSALASQIGNQEEQNRLFMFGYERSKTFIGALRAQKIEEEDISQEAPIFLMLSINDGGPSIDFIIGKIYSLVEESALEDVFKTGNEFNSTEMQKILVENKFRNSNCALIGN